MGQLKNILLIVSIFTAFAAYGQNVTIDNTEIELQNLIDKITTLEKQNIKLNAEINTFRLTLSNSVRRIDSLQMQIYANSDTINKTINELDVKINTTETVINQQVLGINKSVTKTFIWIIAGIFFVIIVSSILYGLLHKKQKSDKADIIERLSKTKSLIEESLVKEFARQTELLDAQFLKQKKENTTNIECDHSFALKVANELNIIQRNINLMDAKTRGLKQIVRSIETLKDNMTANGYEVPQLLGKQFSQGMKVIVESSIPDESLDSGTEIITKILIPQVNYNGIIIQTAQIEVSVGY